MSSRSFRPPLLAAGLTGLALAATGLPGLAATATAAPAAHVVISEVYGGGGNSGATYNEDFVELFNPTASAVNLSGLSVQYRSATGTANPTGVVALSGSIAAGGHYLVGLASGTTGTALPTPDATGSGVNLSGTSGTVFLADQATALTAPPTGSITNNPAIIDLVGYGTSNTYEGTAAASPASAAQSVTRTDPTTDTDVNSADFADVAPTPADSGSTGGGGGTPPPLAQTIAQIQGTDTDTSPDNGDEVSTTGVVTAVYATGGFNGFFLQTGGSGGTAADDATPGASDAVFVYGSASAAKVSIGDSVQVTGKVTEFQGETEIGSPTVTALGTPLPAVQPDTIPWSDLTTDAQKEAHEGELVQPQGDFTVTDDYNANFYGEIELAAGDDTLKQPTDVGTPDSQAAQDAAAYNIAHQVTLDDGSSTTFSPTGASKNSPLPWLTTTTPVSIGSQVTFHQPVVLDYRNSLWKFQPTQPVVGDGSAVATFSDQRSKNAAPAAVGGKVRLATFNMENFFPTTATAFVADNSGATCTYYDDRDGNHLTANTCSFANGDAGPRGAATDDSFQRQLAKEVTSINGLGASVVSLEELENGAKFTQDISGLPSGVDDRDYALQVIVDALNQADGAGTWAFIPTPAAADLPPIGEQDVIRTGFIYKPKDITPVGVSHVLTGDSDAGEPFSIAREPLAQGFKVAGTPDRAAFLVVANHLKSKGADATGLFNDCPGGDAENTDPAQDQGGFNCTRVHEVTDMWAWAQTQAQSLGTDRVFLVGDFNAYDHEDPIEYLLGKGLTDVGATDDPTHSSYSYDGLEGSLDHVLATPSAFAMVTGASIWQINAQESVAFAYSRYNYSGTTPNLFDGSTPWATSDHDPEVVGLDAPAIAGTARSRVGARPVHVVHGKTAHVRVTVHGHDGGHIRPSGTVTLLDGDRVLGTATLDGRGRTVIAFDSGSLAVGKHTLTVAYAGDATFRASTGRARVTVEKK